MDECQFRTEIHEYIDNRYNKFLEYQQHVLDILKEFHRICETNNITYYLSYGTLLGAIRDKGQIPWDYDIDVQVPYEEKDKLINALCKNLNSRYYIYCPEINCKCRHFSSRLSMVGYNSSALHVDIFYLIGTPSDNYQYKKFAKKIKFICQARYYKLVNAKEESLGRKALYAYFMFYKILYGVIPLKILNFAYNKLCNRYSYSNSQYYMTADIFSYKRYNRELYRKREKVKLGDNEYYIPSGYKEILKNFYGDYEVYPSIESRYNEFMSSLDKLEYFSKISKFQI